MQPGILKTFFHLALDNAMRYSVLKTRVAPGLRDNLSYVGISYIAIGALIAGCD